MQDWIEVYKEISDIIKAEIPEIKWIDLWYGQTDLINEDKDYPWPSPAVYIEFVGDNIQDVGQLAQDINARINFYLAYETLADSFEGSDNQSSALAFMPLLTKIHQTFHGKSGTNFSTMARRRIAPIRTGDSLLCYSQGFDSILRDYSAEKTYETAIVTDFPAIVGIKPSTQDDPEDRLYEAVTN